MKNTVLQITLIFLFFSFAKAEEKCSCKDFHNRSESQTELVKSLEKSDLNFNETFETTSVRGITSASYYYCDNDHGFLLVRLHDEELVYKEVPLKVWFEFKFANSIRSYYTDEIKYDFVTI